MGLLQHLHLKHHHHTNQDSSHHLPSSDKRDDGIEPDTMPAPMVTTVTEEDSIHSSKGNPLLGSLKHGLFKALSSTHLRHSTDSKHEIKEGEFIVSDEEINVLKKEKLRGFNLDASQQWNFEGGFLVHASSGRVLTFRSTLLYSKFFQKPNGNLPQDLFPLDLEEKASYGDQKWKFERGTLKNVESGLLLTLDPMNERLILLPKDSREDWKPFQEWTWTSSGHLRNTATGLVLDSSAAGSLQISLPFPVAMQASSKKSLSQQWTWKDDMLFNRGTHLVLTASYDAQRGVTEAFALPPKHYEQQWILESGKIVSKLTLNAHAEIVLGVNKGATMNAQLFAAVHPLGTGNGASLKHQSVSLMFSSNTNDIHTKNINLTIHWRMKKSAILSAVNCLAITVKENGSVCEIWCERALFRKNSNKRRSRNLTDGSAMRYSDEEMDSETERHVNHLTSTLSRSSSLEDIDMSELDSGPSTLTSQTLSGKSSEEGINEQVKKVIDHILEEQSKPVEVVVEPNPLPTHEEIAKKIAPRIVFHTDESSRPCTVESFLRNCKLVNDELVLLSTIEDSKALEKYCGLSSSIARTKWPKLHLEYTPGTVFSTTKSYVRVVETGDFLDFEYWFLFPEHRDYLCPYQPEPEWLVPYLGERQGVWKRVTVRASRYGNILKVIAEAKNVELHSLNLKDFNLKNVKPSATAENASFPEVDYFESNEENPEGYQCTNTGHPILYCSLKTHCFYPKSGKQGFWHLMDETSDGSQIDYGREMEMMNNLQWKSFAGLWGKNGSLSPQFHDACTNDH